MLGREIAIPVCVLDYYNQTSDLIPYSRKISRVEIFEVEQILL